MFDLRAPCGNCPFRQSKGANFALSEDRILEIVEASAFQCHKTVDYDHEDPVKRQGDKPQQCAGLMALLHAMGEPNEIMLAAEELIGFDASQIDTADTYPDLESVLLDHCHGHG